jgi:hypothetical protein
MLPINFLTNRKLSFQWHGPQDFNDFVPSLKRADTFYQCKQVILLESSLFLNKNTRILSFIMGTDEVRLLNTKISLSQASNETNFLRTLRKLVLDNSEETVNFVQGLGESENLSIKNLILKLA